MLLFGFTDPRRNANAFFKAQVPNNKCETSDLNPLGITPQPFEVVEAA
jgi:hypothetical protein